MKIRVKLLGAIHPFNKRMADNQVDDILVWAMEHETDIEFYKYYIVHASETSNYGLWAIFTIQSEDAFMFMLRWNGEYHKNKVKGKSK
jgi:hypothetical protein